MPATSSTDTVPVVLTPLAEHESASNRKLAYFRPTATDDKENIDLELNKNGSPEGFRVIDIGILSGIISKLCCPECLCQDLNFREKKRFGIAPEIEIICNNCKLTYTELLSPKIGNKTSSRIGYEVNHRAVAAITSLGHGHTGLQQFFAAMNMPKPLHCTTFQNIQKSLENSSEAAVSELLQLSASKIREVYNDLGIIPDKQNILDISVSFDGTWQKKRFFEPFWCRGCY